MAYIKGKLLKTLSIIIILLMGWMAFRVPADGQTTTLSVFPAQTSVPALSQAKVGLRVTNGVNINSFDISITYNTEMLQLDGWENGDYLSDLTVVKKVEEAGSLNLICTQSEGTPVSGNGVLIYLYFRGKIFGTTEVVVDAVEFSDAAGNVTSPARVNGTIEIIYASTYTSTATFTVTSLYTATNTRTPTPTSATALTPTPTNTTTPTPDLTQTRFFSQQTEIGLATFISTSTHNPTFVFTPGQITPQQSNTPIYLVGSVEGSSSGPVVIPLEEEREANLEFLWVVIPVGLLLILTLLIILIRKKISKTEDFLI